MAALYGAILGRIEHECYDVFSARAVVPGWHKVLWFAWVAFVRLPRSLLSAPAAETAVLRRAQRSDRRVAVIGAGFAGLTAAALLSKRGFSVDVFEQQSSIGGKAQSVHEGGVTLDLGPTLLTMPSVARGLFAELGAEDLMPRLHTLDEQCAYRFADGSSFSAHSDIERMAAAASQFGHDEARAIHSFFAEAESIYRAAGEPFLAAPFSGMLGYGLRVAAGGPRALTLGLGMSTLHALACRHFKSAHLRQFIGRFATYVGGSPFEMSAAYAMIAHLERSQGVHHVEGGMGALARRLATAAARLGVRVHLGAPARAERVGDGFVVSHGTERALYDEVVINADPLTEVAPVTSRLSMSGHVLALNVPRRLALSHHSVFFSADYASEFASIACGLVPSDPTVYVCHPAASDSTMAEPGRSGLFVMINAAPVGGDYREAQGRRAIFSALQRAGVDVSPATIIAERTPADFARFGAPKGALYGALGHGRLGPFFRPKAQGRDGRWFAGGGTHPGGGVPMVMLSGRFAANAITHGGQR
ncbi:MAG: phytoene desaturase [Deltaproteobacteria bacterium]|nr:phytoene desaturase [Deltaproteobacteria bacterium]